MAQNSHTAGMLLNSEVGGLGVLLPVACECGNALFQAAMEERKSLEENDAMPALDRGANIANVRPVRFARIATIVPSTRIFSAALFCSRRYG